VCYGDVIREITANGFAWVHRHYVGVQSVSALIRPSNRQVSGSTNGQPKGVASADDGTVCVVTANGVEVYAGGNIGKTVTYLPLKANLNCIAVHGKMVAAGGEVCLPGPPAVAFSSDGKWLAAGESSGNILVFSDGSGLQVGR